MQKSIGIESESKVDKLLHLFHLMLMVLFSYSIFVHLDCAFGNYPPMAVRQLWLPFKRK